MAEWFRFALAGPVVRRGLKYAVFVGALLIAINQGGVILNGELRGEHFLRMGLTVVVPYLVSTFSSVSAMRENQRERFTTETQRAQRRSKVK